jgi:hypothetical protein
MCCPLARLTAILFLLGQFLFIYNAHIEEALQVTGQMEQAWAAAASAAAETAFNESVAATTAIFCLQMWHLNPWMGIAPDAPFKYSPDAWAFQVEVEHAFATTLVENAVCVVPQPPSDDPWLTHVSAFDAHNRHPLGNTYPSTCDEPGS